MHDGHDHHHPPLAADPPETEQVARSRVMEAAVRSLLIEKGLVTADEIRVAVEEMDARSPAAGARLVARAWVDPEFMALLLSDAPAACRELGIDIGPLRLIAVANTDLAHNVIVCTLCSCYPRFLLGLPPDWYKARAYRSRLVREPRVVLSEFGLILPPTMSVRVHDSTADMRYIVVPSRPQGTAHLGEDALAALVGRDAMIGVALARSAS